MSEPSLRYTTVSVRGGRRESCTDFILGRNTRHESSGCTGFCDGDPIVPGAMVSVWICVKLLPGERHLPFRVRLRLTWQRLQRALPSPI
jgi:hypothetical protein